MSVTISRVTTRCTIWRVAEPLSTDTVTPPRRAADILHYPDGRARRRIDVGRRQIPASTSSPSGRCETRPVGISAARIYRLPPRRGSRPTWSLAEFVDSVPIVPTPNNGRVHGSPTPHSPTPIPRGTRCLAVRSYDDVFVFAIDSCRLQPCALTGTCSLQSAQERNSGEGLTWLVRWAPVVRCRRRAFPPAFRSVSVAVVLTLPPAAPLTRPLLRYNSTQVSKRNGWAAPYGPMRSLFPSTGTDHGSRVKTSRRSSTASAPMVRRTAKSNPVCGSCVPVAPSTSTSW